MTEYICKCGRTIRKATNADTTGIKLDGYGPGHECFGCPYVVEHRSWRDGGMQLDHHECIASRSLHYKTLALPNSFEQDTRVGHIYSLDWDFLHRVADECDKYPEHIKINRENTGVMFGYKSKYREDGRFDFCIYPTSNKAGAKAKREIFELFFTPEGLRKDLNGAQEKEKILKDIEKALHPAQAEPQPEVSLVEAAAAPLADRPSFDYSGLSQRTVDVMRLAEKEILESRQTDIVRVSNAVALVHEAVVANCDNGADGVVPNWDNSKHGHRGEETFRAWCASVGISKSAAYRFLQVDRLLSGSSPEELATLEAASPSLLYAAANPSAPAELVQSVKDGDITTHKQYQDLLAELRRKDSEISQLADQCQQAEREREFAKNDARTMENDMMELQLVAASANARATEAERKVAELEARPIEVAVQQPSEVDLARYRAEGAEDARRKYAAQIASADAARKKSDDKLKKLQETLQGRTDHLNAVEAELAKVKKQLKAQSTPQTLQAVPCSQCSFEQYCCGIVVMDDVGIDEDDINNRLTGCTAGMRKE